MLILNFEDVLKSISMPQAIAGMRQGFAALGRGEVVMPSRTIVDVDKFNGEMLVMPSFVAAETDALAVKVVGVFPNNVDKGIPSVLGAVCVLDAETCKPLALLDGAAITGVRTAAVSAVATDYLSKANSRVLAVIGTGVQARTHVEAVCTVRRIERIQIYGRNPVKRDRWSRTYAIWQTHLQKLWLLIRVTKRSLARTLSAPQPARPNPSFKIPQLLMELTLTQLVRTRGMHEKFQARRLPGQGLWSINAARH